jgi:DNA-binding transcriptional ArsR family regulator
MSDSPKQHPRRGDDRSTSQRERQTAGSTRQHRREVGTRLTSRPERHPAASRSELDQLGTEIVATRLRTLGHPMRVRILRALDGRQATAEQLAEHLCAPLPAIRGQIAVLYRAGVLCRVDEGGRPTYELADWPSLWLVEQLARRLRLRASEDGPSGSEEQPACR